MVSKDKTPGLCEEILELKQDSNDSLCEVVFSPRVDLSIQLRAVEVPMNPLSEIGDLTSESIEERLSENSLDLSRTGLFQYKLSIDLPPDMLSKVTKLDLSRNSIDDFSAVKVSGFLEELDISFNHVTSLEPLKDLKFLQVLKAQHNQVSSILPLKELKSLRTLNLCKNNIHSLPQSYRVLKQLQGVNQLHIDRNPCFTKTKLAFDILAVGLALNVLNGVNLIDHYKQFDAVVLNRIRALNSCQLKE